MKFAHIADTHIRNLKYHREYKEVFQCLYKKLDNLDVSVDDLIATTTGETNVGARQQAGGAPPSSDKRQEFPKFDTKEKDEKSPGRRQEFPKFDTKEKGKK